MQQEAEDRRNKSLLGPDDDEGAGSRRGGQMAALSIKDLASVGKLVLVGGGNALVLFVIFYNI